MKSVLLIAAAAAALAACATASQPQATSYSATQTSFEGWINFAGEEFQLVEDQNAYVSGRTRPCLSGALPRDEQRTARATIGRQKVRVTGTTLTWSDDLPGDRYDQQGSNIRNECDGAFVVLASDIAVIL